ncbi:hypothetical protein [Streptomyces sp. BK205]|uniref:hypothetical protein n=1 Tax=Streptomyces sp. BK205 TaxID=2512164 RepID=UPI001FB4E8E4|nr:hypothetical protein [Streptomyces sp. BK205]
MNARTRGGAEETRVLVVEDDRGIAESLVRGGVPEAACPVGRRDHRRDRAR